MAEMWALSPETKGCSCGIGDRASDALCANPELQSLRPEHLAQRLGVSNHEAQEAIVRVAKYAGGGMRPPVGVSLDEALAGVGRGARPTEAMYSHDAAGLFWDDYEDEPEERRGLLEARGLCADACGILR